MSKWEMAFNQSRRKDKFSITTENSLANGRLEIERDYDRILFAAPTRRLADKTQVFPLDKNDSVRTRLTHSLEVSAIARNIGTRLAYESPSIFTGLEEKTIQRCIPSLLAAIGLVHDMGNPPFGHQGEYSIQAWFEKNCEEVFGSKINHAPPTAKDFLKFDGNSQTFRLLTRLQILSDKYGLNLTYGTLAALIKYPVSSADIGPGSWKKHGYFHSEKDVAEEIWKETGLGLGIRHPFTYIMEACDDIAYAVMDAEDTIKKGLASFPDLVNFLEQNCSDDKLTKKIINKSKEKYDEFKKIDLSPRELNDCVMQMFRVYSIHEMTSEVTNFFVDKAQSLLGGECYFDGILKETQAASFCKALKKFDFTYGFRHKSVLELELKGHTYIHTMMDMLWVAVHGNQEKAYDSITPFGKYAFSRISESYRRIFKEDNGLSQSYKEAQLITDAVSGMTDSYLISLHDELLPFYEKHCKK
ncbi:dGTP triphosphohydrolase [Pseudomonas oryzihabitans]|uniref:dGTP triphosphohydrolase n=1 Tax=Pseudomonas oryzihabitans TaxID=47885 RepID=UPI0011203D1F|nr:dNTP triphosphohydrolase [Pseudomonas psychrotolerans]QDD89406.1 deoxyguanosinetriphosphate triphosphohydrolase [Pseudomonas psychrotolerans]